MFEWQDSAKSKRAHSNCLNEGVLAGRVLLPSHNSYQRENDCSKVGLTGRTSIQAAFEARSARAVSAIRPPSARAIARSWAVGCN
jgi:hypothetical protein